MNRDAEHPVAWQPITVRGVASFAFATFSRVFALQFLFALFAATAVWFYLERALEPCLHAAIQNLPEEGSTLQDGWLKSSRTNALRLAENNFLAIFLDPTGIGPINQTSDLQLEIGRDGLGIRWLFGFEEIPYQRDWSATLNPGYLEPWWGAYKGAMKTIISLGVFCGLLLCWQALATLYAIPAWLLGFFTDRSLTIFGAWRLAAAALLPGAFFLTWLIVFYTLGRVNLMSLLVGFGLHMPVGWIYLAAATWQMPVKQGVLRGNPFK